MRPIDARKPNSGWRWRQFSLRRLFLVMLLAGSALGWLGSKIHAARQRAAVVQQVIGLGGSVRYDLNDRGNCIPRPPAAWERLFDPGLRQETLHNLTRIQVQHPRMLDSGPPIPLAGLEYCSELRQVSLTGGTGIDENVARLGNARRLQELVVRGEVTDRGLAPLAGLSRLHELRLSRFPASDAPLTVLPRSPHLHRLELQGFPVSRELLEQVGNYQELEFLTLEGTQLSDEGLAALPALEKLTSLSLAGNPIRGPGLVVLERFPALEYLDLSGTRHYDAEDLTPLVRCLKLRRVSIAKTAASVAFLKARPDIRIE